MQVLRALRNAAAYDLWLTPYEIGQGIAMQTVEAAPKNNSVTSAIRRLRTEGFIINHTKRHGRIRQYSLRRDQATR
jgi:DNA-binding PadR family transcriptional regulator